MSFAYIVCLDVCMHAFMNVGRLWMAKWLSIPTVARLKDTRGRYINKNNTNIYHLPYSMYKNAF